MKKNEKLFEEGQRAIRKEHQTAREEKSGGLEVDARKMIIFSELLKPKFDEGLN